MKNFKLLFVLSLLFIVGFNANAQTDSVNYETAYWKLKYEKELTNSAVIGVNSKKYREANKLVLALGVSHTFGLYTHYTFRYDIYKLAPAFEVKLGNQHIRGHITLGFENKIGFELGKYFTIGVQAGYRTGNIWVVEGSFGGRIPLNRAQSITLNIQHSASLLLDIPGQDGLQLGMGLVRVGLNCSLARK